MQSDSIAALSKALSLAHGQMTGAKKDKKNPFFKSNYADLHTVIETAREPLTNNGLVVIQTTDMTEFGLVVVTTLSHESGEWIRGTTPVKAMKEDPQAMGSAITYARRYAYAAICGIAQMDDDGESAMNRGQVNGTVLDMGKITKAVNFIKQTIDADIPEEDRAGKLLAARDKLNNDEILEVNKLLNDVAQGTKKKYKNIFHDYLKVEEVANG